MAIPVACGRQVVLRAEVAMDQSVVHAQLGTSRLARSTSGMTETVVPSIRRGRHRSVKSKPSSMSRSHEATISASNWWPAPARRIASAAALPNDAR